MPVFDLRLAFDESGALKAARRLDEVSDAADKAQKSVSKVQAVIGKLRLLGLAALAAVGAAFLKVASDGKELADKLKGLEAQMQVLGARADWTRQQMTDCENAMRKNGVDALSARQGVLALTKAHLDAQKALPMFSAALDATVISGKKVNETLEIMANADAKMAELQHQALAIAEYYDQQTAQGRLKKIKAEAEAKRAKLKEALNEKQIEPEVYKKAIADIDKAEAEAGKRASVGAGKIDSARESIRRIREEIAQLNGESEKSSATLNKKIVEIENLGKKADMSAAEIKKLAQEYKDAFQKDTVKEFDKKIVQVTNNSSALKQIENQDTLDVWRDKFKAAGMSVEEMTERLEKLNGALEQQGEYENLQTAVKFMEDLQNLGVEYGQTTEWQYQLIEKQAALYTQNLGPAMQGYVEEWKKLQGLQKSQSGWDGAIRGAMKFGSQYGNVAQQVESLTMQMGSTISNTLANAFMSGKLSAQDFFRALVAMAAQAATNAFVGKIIGGIGSLFGGGSRIAGGFGGMDAYEAANPWNAKDNVFTGAGISAYSGSIVSSPTLFAYDNYLTRFAHGAGLMGEDGPEAIMPLARGRDGYLGVRVAQGGAIAPQIAVNIINNSPAQVESGPMKRDGNDGFSMDVIISQVEQGIVGRMKQGKSQIAQYQEKTYGMNRASVIARSRGRN